MIARDFGVAAISPFGFGEFGRFGRFGQFSRFGGFGRFGDFGGIGGFGAFDGIGGGFIGDGFFGGGFSDYPLIAGTTSPNIIVVSGGGQPTQSRRVEDLPPCHEVTAVGVVIERGMACSRAPG